MYKFFKNSLAILYWEMAITSSQIAELVIFSHVSSGVNVVHINIIRLPIKTLLLLLFPFLFTHEGMFTAHGFFIWYTHFAFISLCLC